MTKNDKETVRIPLQSRDVCTTEADDDSDREWKCGWLSWRPRGLQGCANMRTFTVVLSLANLFGSINHTYFTSVITQIERAFGLSSSMTGFIKNVDHIGYICTVLLVGHFCRYSNKPRLLAVATLLVAFAVFTFSLPHFIYGVNTYPVARDGYISAVTYGNISSFEGNISARIHLLGPSLCENRTEAGESERCERRTALRAFNTGAFAIFICSELMQGMASTPKTTLTITYMDDNAKKNSPKHFGVMFALRSLAPVIGFGIGAWATTVYVDLTDTDLTPTDPRWVGAWWLGFLVCAISTVVWALPLSLFPPKIKGADLGDKKDENMNQNESKSLLERSKDLPDAICRLVKNKLYMALMAALASEIYMIGYFTFVPKYVEQQFRVTAAIASIITGAVGCVVMIIGPIVSGQIVSRLNMTPRRMMGMVTIISGLSVLGFAINMFVYCPEVKWAGTLTIEGVNLTQTCNNNCTCDDLDFSPVCGSGGVQYFSPCHAGCTLKDFDPTTKITSYHGCQCIADGEAKSGVCKSECKMFMVYAAVQLLAAISFSMYIIPLFTIFLRCVKSKDKAMSLAGGSFVTMIISFPSPILFGAVIDTTCIFKQSSCTRTGACLLYDLDQLRYKLHGTLIGFKVLALLFYGLAYYFTCTKAYAKWPNEESDQNERK